LNDKHCCWVTDVENYASQKTQVTDLETPLNHFCDP